MEASRPPFCVWRLPHKELYPRASSAQVYVLPMPLRNGNPGQTQVLKEVGLPGEPRGTT